MHRAQTKGPWAHIGAPKFTVADMHADPTIEFGRSQIQRARVSLIFSQESPAAARRERLNEANFAYQGDARSNLLVN